MSTEEAHGWNRSFFFSREGLIWVICIIWSLFQLYTAGIGLLQQPVQRAVHVGFALCVAFLLFPAKHKALRFTDVLLIAGAIAGCGYVALFYPDIIRRAGNTEPYELVLGAITIIVVLEATRRVLGWVLPCLALVFLLYCWIGNYAPGFLMIRGYSLPRIIQHMYLTNEGVFGVAAGVSATYIFMFILFGAFLSASGGAKLFNDISLAVAGRFSGGPAKVSIIGSGLMGSINGSSIANVATVGALTIPMMKQVGYSPEQSAGIEACASTGGQFMPPIMGTGAFIMADFLNMPYLDIAKAAVFPAILYYLAIFVHVHFVAKKRAIGGIHTDFSVGGVLLKQGYLFLPIILIVAMLILGYTPLKAAFYAVIAIWLLSYLGKKNRMTPGVLLNTLAGGAKGAVSTAIACAVVGFIIGSCSLTALGLTFSGNLLDLTDGSVLMTLCLSMLACLILGMGLPTTANYIVTCTIIAPALIKLGVTALAANLFVFYFGIMADITPPVCLATYTASGIAQASPARAALTGFSIALPSFFLPYMFVYEPSILWGQGILPAIYTTCLDLLGICGVTACAVGWMGVRLNPVLRVLALLAGVTCFWPQATIHWIGAAVVAAIWLGASVLGNKSKQAIA